MSKQNKFNLGDIVKLKSGGPDMTVKEVVIGYNSNEFTGNYHCQWFAGKKLDVGTFPEESIVAVNTDK